MRRGRFLSRLMGAALAAAAAGSCQEQGTVPAHRVDGGDPERGKGAIQKYGCGACHVIPGIPGAQGLVGPPLNYFAARQYIAGAVVNTPDNLVRWIENPQAIEPGTVMPNLGVTQSDARDIAAYLHTLEAPSHLGPPHPLPAEWLHPP